MKFKYDVIVYNVIDIIDYNYIKNILVDNNISVMLSTPYVLPIYLLIYLNKKVVTYHVMQGSSFKNIGEYINFRNRNNNYFINTFIYDKNNINILKHILKYGTEVPNYIPRYKI